MIEVFLLKLLDVMLNTVRSAFFVRNKHFLASLLTAISTFTYFLIIVKLLQISSFFSIALVSLAAFLGSYIPPIIIRRLEKDKVWVFDITPNSNENGKEFANQMRNKGFSVVTYKSYNKGNECVVCSKVFSKNKTHSRLIKKNIPRGFKWHIVSAID
ncbi:MAG: hypothetical protein UT66_C0028G0025 [candidate division CPR2 bacterium GW2011_GWC1_39_9]|uniref:Uncharacterized protein n=1 Tax=candidate division CPR2 bacterium GW2011_GWC2_39_10 TaxID=1618345 RepID=A0A0G0M365_UNCC2|nr:MAG: hypothetical protein UT18_C0007G0051 [candidate division CPR2 bacterium GW2011_GWC2_39_10]KKR34134.1 MAG: hypothetical protein UT66_C0028G0025 [candidate division CPR2 bacterium GW2011_GWC1_39_9]